MPKIKIRWKRSHFDWDCTYDVYLTDRHNKYLNKRYIGELTRGNSVEVPVEVGEHTLYFEQKVKVGTVVHCFFDIQVHKKSVKLWAIHDKNGLFVVDYVYEIRKYKKCGN